MSVTITKQLNHDVLTFWRICQVYDYFFVNTLVREFTDDNPSFWDSVAELLLERGLLCSVISDELSTEVEYTLSETQLFRSNKGITYIMAALSRKLTEDLLIEYINPLIEQINTNNTTLEIDSSKVDEETARKNVETVINFVDQFFENVNEMTKHLPLELTFIFTRVRLAVAAKYGDEEALKIVGAFLFLRLLNPVLITPQKFSTKLTKPNPTSIRTFIIVTKITQACVNQPSTPFQELYMQPITKYAVNKYQFVTDLLSSVSQNNTNPTTPTQTPIRPSLLFATAPNILVTLRKFSTSNTEKFKNFCEIIRRRGHTNLLEQFVSMIDPSGALAKSIELENPKYCGVILDQFDKAKIDEMIHGFDDVIECYQNKMLKYREQIVELQDEVNKKKNIIPTKTTAIEIYKDNKNLKEGDKLSVPTNFERKRTIFHRSVSMGGRKPDI
ncbi:Ras-GAP domain-containing protein [Entamoeba marina]